MRVRGGINAPKTKVPYPNTWVSVKSTYAAITNKLMTDGTPDQKTQAIDYWVQRLTEDRDLVKNGKPPATDDIT